MAFSMYLNNVLKMPISKEDILVNEGVKRLAESLGPHGSLVLENIITDLAGNYSKGAHLTESFHLYLEQVFDANYIRTASWAENYIFTIPLHKGIMKEDTDNVEYKIFCIADKEHVYLLNAVNVNDPKFEWYLDHDYHLIRNKQILYDEVHKGKKNSEDHDAWEERVKSKRNENLEAFRNYRFGLERENALENSNYKGIKEAIASFNEIIEKEIKDKRSNPNKDKANQSSDGDQRRKNSILKELMDVNERLAVLYARVYEYRNNDPEAALNNARKCAEVIVKVLSFQINPKRPSSTLDNLDNDIKELYKKNVISKLNSQHLRTIQSYGNFGSHDQGDESQELNAEMIEPCIAALNSLIEWWLQRNID